MTISFSWDSPLERLVRFLAGRVDGFPGSLNLQWVDQVLVSNFFLQDHSTTGDFVLEYYVIESKAQNSCDSSRVGVYHEKQKKAIQQNMSPVV